MVAVRYCTVHHAEAALMQCRAREGRAIYLISSDMNVESKMWAVENCAGEKLDRRCTSEVHGVVGEHSGAPALKGVKIAR